MITKICSYVLLSITDLKEADIWRNELKISSLVIP